MGDLQKLFPDETIHFELPPSEKTLDVDRAQIEQVLINLLKNAREASARREEPKIEVKATFAPKVTSSLTSWRCTIIVRDNGEGILPEVQDKIFVPFFTTKTAGSLPHSSAATVSAKLRVRVLGSAFASKL